MSWRTSLSGNRHLREAAPANTWAGNAPEFRRTQWSNDRVSDSNGEAFYIRDEESGYFWCRRCCPAGHKQSAVCVAPSRLRYSVFETCGKTCIRSETLGLCCIDDRFKFRGDEVRNNSAGPAALHDGFISMGVGDGGPKSMSTWTYGNSTPTKGVIFAKNNTAWNSQRASRSSPSVM